MLTEKMFVSLISQPVKAEIYICYRQCFDFCIPQAELSVYQYNRPKALQLSRPIRKEKAAYLKIHQLACSKRMKSDKGVINGRSTGTEKLRL